MPIDQVTQMIILKELHKNYKCSKTAADKFDTGRRSSYIYVITVTS